MQFPKLKKNSWDGLNSQMDMTEQRVSELEDRLIEIIQDEEETLKKKLTEPYGPIR